MSRRGKSPSGGEGLLERYEAGARRSRFLLALGLLGLQCWGMYGGRFPLALACCAGVAALYARPLWRGITTGLRSLKRGG